LAKQVGEAAKENKIELSIHAPFYINLASDEKEKIAASKTRILESCKRGHYFGSKNNPTKIVFHPAYFGKTDKEEVYQKTRTAMEDMHDKIRASAWNAILCPETTGKHSALGSLEETLRLAKEIKCSFCIDLAHLYARANGHIDYEAVLKQVGKHKHLHFHFSGINYSTKGELNHLIMGHKPDFKPFAQLLLKRKQDCTIISESPITWKDSLKMKQIFEKLGHIF
ncbi:MAG: TIM barrel protein, partial [Candidatus Aenigmatarchaeota archaeon]